MSGIEARQRELETLRAEVVSLMAKQQKHPERALGRT